MSAPARIASTAASGPCRGRDRRIGEVVGQRDALEAELVAEQPGGDDGGQRGGHGEVAERVERVRERHARHSGADRGLERDEVTLTQLIELESDRRRSLLGRLVGGAETGEVCGRAEHARPAVGLDGAARVARDLLRVVGVDALAERRARAKADIDVRAEHARDPEPAQRPPRGERLGARLPGGREVRRRRRGGRPGSELSSPPSCLVSTNGGKCRAPRAVALSLAGRARRAAPGRCSSARATTSAPRSKPAQPAEDVRARVRPFEAEREQLGDLALHRQPREALRDAARKRSDQRPRSRPGGGGGTILARNDTRALGSSRPACGSGPPPDVVRLARTQHGAGHAPTPARARRAVPAAAGFAGPDPRARRER